VLSSSQHLERVDQVADVREQVAHVGERERVAALNVLLDLVAYGVEMPSSSWWTATTVGVRTGSGRIAALIRTALLSGRRPGSGNRAGPFTPAGLGAVAQ
jgi:hypothetical protein